jgi:uncharacterized delta-60 repeat protein
MKVLFAISFVLFFSISTFSQQSIYQEWAARYNGSANAYDGGVAVKTDAMGNVFVTGTSFNVNTARDFVTIKYSSNGGQLWVRTYNGTANGGDYANAMAVDNMGNVYVTGRCDNGSPTLSDYTTIKYSPDGNLDWVAFYNGPANGVDEAKAIAVDNSGNVYVTGRCLGTGNNQDIATVKYDNNGNQLWVRTYIGPGNGDDIAYSINVDPANNVYIAGESKGINSGTDAIVIKYNSDGEQQWIQRYNGPANGGDVAVGVKTDANNNVVITGYSDGGSTGQDYLTIKYNSSGVQQWLARYNGPGGLGDFATALALDLSGNVYVTGGSVDNSGIADSIYATIKYNVNGNQMWVSFYPGPSNSVNVARAIDVDNSGNVFITGSSMFGGLNHYVTIKYNQQGTQTWLMTYSGMVIGNGYATSLALDNITNNVYVTGRSYGADYDIATLKYGPELLGIQKNGNNIPVSYSLSQNYPNPFNPGTTIDFSIPNSGNVKLSIFDITGNKIAEPVNQNLNASNYSVKWDASNFGSGVYFYKLQVNGFTSTKKMMLVK